METGVFIILVFEFLALVCHVVAITPANEVTYIFVALFGAASLVLTCVGIPVYHTDNCFHFRCSASIAFLAITSTTLLAGVFIICILIYAMCMACLDAKGKKGVVHPALETVSILAEPDTPPV